MSTPRQSELESVSPELRDHWLAGQLDEVETRILDEFKQLVSRMNELAEALKQNTLEQVNTRQRFTWLALSISSSLLMSVLIGVFTFVLTR